MSLTSSLSIRNTGRVAAFDGFAATSSSHSTAGMVSSLDPSSQMIKIFIKVKGKSLKEGMFLNGIAKGAVFNDVTIINRKLLKNGGVYLVDSNIVKYKKIEVLHTNQAEAIVKGLEDGEEYVTDNMKGLYEGLKVTIEK